MTDNRTNEQLAERLRQFAESQAMDFDSPHVAMTLNEVADRLVAAQGAAPAVSGSTSDGYHTFDELYEYRMLYNAHAAHGWLAAGIPVVKSWRHSDGEACFGGGWFIVTATLPSGQVSNHYKAEHWGLFKVPEVDLPPEYDGHTPHDAAMRLRVEAEHAAQGAAPQAECDCGAGPGSAVCKRVCATRAPVQPSSTVDEAALIREAKAEAWDAGVATALNYAKRQPDGITLKLETLDGYGWPNPYREGSGGHD